LQTDLRKTFKAFWEDEYVATRLYRYMGEQHEEMQEAFEKLASMESKHGTLWERLYVDNSDGRKPSASFSLKAKLALSKWFMKLIGYSAFVKYMELSESSAIRTYGELLEHPDLAKQRDVLKEVIIDEVQHEVTLLSEVVRMKSDIDDVRNAVYGMVDALVEVLAIVVGLASALVNPVVVALGGIISASAGTLSMSAGAYLSSKSQRDLAEGKLAEVSVRSKVVPQQEAKRIEKKLKSWGLSEQVASEISDEIADNPKLAEAMDKAVDLGFTEEALEDPKKAAKNAGLYYFMGALAPILPFVSMVTGELGILLAVVFSLTLLSIASAVIAMLSGVGLKRKVVEMDTVALAASLATFAIGYAARTFLGLAV
jgi:VIT1/CCC1 family predicted Fe2+/Mn2+ transporter